VAKVGVGQRNFHSGADILVCLEEVKRTDIALPPFPCPLFPSPFSLPFMISVAKVGAGLRPARTLTTRMQELTI